ncbi:cytochrome c [Thiohalobacter thiocyanaticus]|uniref:Cytochrome c n=1 Tax=Thiohalobacter thiocyanaticus TaxID=585455 RepID=A0A1Z4VPY8_9GAMM|nr:c-type cytochrome [Thiohalobacter thiocyanaticus]BAZ93700.1 cytochrome c [Thiohalobacter thiocyanaticus]
MNRSLYLIAVLLLCSTVLKAGQADDEQAELPDTPAGAPAFTPPAESELPDGPFGEMVRYGRDLFVDTQQLRGRFVGNGLNCVNCHIDAGRRADSAPLWAAYTMYPAYRSKNDRVNTMEQRIQGCFRYSMNGAPPPSGSRELSALLSYHYWLAQGAPVGVALAGRGYPKLDDPANPPDISRGRQVFEAQCALCHGEDGQGRKAEGVYAFPPLWGTDSYNWGAGMHRVNTAAAFIHANMPLGRPQSLSVQQAWDVAAFINSHERPQDPRHDGDLEETDATFHAHQCHYGDELNGQPLGSRAHPNPLQ